MKREKMKEIKECLKNCINDCGALSCPYNKYEKGLKCIEDLQKDCLTLINELERDNKIGQEHLEMWFRKNEEKKKRIVELEKEIKEKNSYAKGYAEGIKNTYEAFLYNNENLEKLEKTINEEYADISDYKNLVCKDTAEKILNELYCTPKEQIKNKIKELARFIGVEIKE